MKKLTAALCLILLSLSVIAFTACESTETPGSGTETPDSVTSIGERAFQDCNSLTRIKYRGTWAQWNAISKGSYWNYDTGYTITYEYVGE